MPDTDTTSEDPTKTELYERAQALDIDGRSTMSKEELAEAVAAAEHAPPSGENDTETPQHDWHELLRHAFLAGIKASGAPDPHLSSDEVRQAIRRATGIDVA